MTVRKRPRPSSAILPSGFRKEDGMDAEILLALYLLILLTQKMR